MKTIVLLAILGTAALAQNVEKEPVESITGEVDADKNKFPVKLGYRAFNPHMTGTAGDGARWFEKADGNLADGKYHGPHNNDWGMTDSQKAYWSYNDKVDSGFQSHDHIRADISDVNDDFKKANAEENKAEAFWKAHTKQEKFFSMYHSGGHKQSNMKAFSADDVQLDNLGDHAGTYMEQKQYLDFFTNVNAEAANICKPSTRWEKNKTLGEGETAESHMIDGIRSRHDSGSTFQGCSLDNCAVTVMYRCSFRCTQCVAQWCKDDCQKQKERSGSCFKVWDGIDEDKCSNIGLTHKDGENTVLKALADVN